MNMFLISGILIVNLALICYSVFFFMKKEREIGRRAILILTAGVFFDLLATILMIIGSGDGFITFHGVIGYSALLGMIVEAVYMWRSYLAKATITRGLKTLTRSTYLWWVFVYIVGFVMIMAGR